MSKRRRNKQRNNLPQTSVLSIVKNKPKQSRVIRYMGTSTGSPTTVTNLDLLKILAFTTNASTTYHQIYRNVLLRSVRLTVMANNDTGSGAVSFSWLGSRTPETDEVFLATTGVVTARNLFPPEDSFASMWITTADTSTSIFIITVPTDMLIFLDLHYEYILEDGTTTTYTSTISTVTGIQAPIFPVSDPAYTAVDLSVI